LCGRHAGDPSLGRIDAEPVQPFGNRGSPLGHVAVDQLAGVVAVLDLDLVAWANQVTGDIQFPAVDQDMSVADDLPGLGPAGGEAQAGDHVVEPTLEQGHQGVARIAGPAVGLRIVLAELTLEDPVVALDFLLLAEADGILAGLAPAILMHAGHPFATVHGALRGVAPRSLEEQFGSLAAAEPTHRSSITSHGSSAFLGRDEFVKSISIAGSDNQTRRFLGGRQPLCGSGVTSSMALIDSPDAWMAVMALSRPDPGPLTLTSTSLTPYFVAVAAAVSAARCAANGVLLRVPLNPTVSDEAQHNASPLG